MYPGQPEKQQTNVIVGARLATVSRFTVGCLPVCNNLYPLEDNGG
jgi:hypothetical protein